MTEQKMTAGYFDQKRNSPMYEGDVYVLPFEEPPFFKIAKFENDGYTGFRIGQVGTSNTYLLSEFGKRLVEEGKFIGNEQVNPHTIDEYIEIAAETAELDTAGQAENSSDSEIQTAIEEQSEIVETETLDNSGQTEKDETDEPIYSTNSDVDTESEFSADTTNNEETARKENSTDAGHSNQPDECSKEEGTVSAAATTGNSNVLVEESKNFEIIANNSDEKAALLRVKLLDKHITENNAQITTLQDKVEYHTQLASTLTYEPFVKLKNLVSEALHSNVDEENVKGIKERTKDFESIINIQNLLKEHERLADKAEQDIADLEDEIAKFETEKAELNEKIETFSRQQKIGFNTED